MKGDIFAEVEAQGARLGLPAGFYSKLLQEDDWSFVIKLNALVEAACSDALAARLHAPELAACLATLDLGHSKHGKVVLLRVAEGAASTSEREAGFLEAMKSHPGITVLVDNRYGGATVASAQDASMNLIDKVREADGIFCPNESTTQGMLLALRQTGLAGKKLFVGFDTSGPLLSALNKGDIQALVAQNPRKMGYLGVMTVVKHIRGEKVEAAIDTGCVLVTKANENTPEVQTIIGGN